MKYVQLDIATSSFFGSLVIGLGSLYLGGKQKCPNTVLFIPALLPMIRECMHTERYSPC
jgi:uncharacterized membrane protein YjjB (DUF3815 family)